MIFPQDTILVSAAADDKKNTMTFSIRFRVRTPLSEREFETVRETYLAFPVPFPPSLKTYTAVNIPVPGKIIMELIRSNNAQSFFLRQELSSIVRIDFVSHVSPT